MNTHKIGLAVMVAAGIGCTASTAGTTAGMGEGGEPPADLTVEDARAMGGVWQNKADGTLIDLCAWFGLYGDGSCDEWCLGTQIGPLVGGHADPDCDEPAPPPRAECEAQSVGGVDSFNHTFSPILGYRWNGHACESFAGYDCAGEGTDSYSYPDPWRPSETRGNNCGGSVFRSLTDCMVAYEAIACLSTEEACRAQEIRGVDDINFPFSPVLGYRWTGTQCEAFGGYNCEGRDAGALSVPGEHSGEWKTVNGCGGDVFENEEDCTARYLALGCMPTAGDIGADH